MQQGHFAAHIRRIRQLYREQRDALAETLTRRAAGRLDVALPDQGMHLVAYLRDGSSDIEVEAAAQRRYRRPCDQPLLSRSPPAARPDARLFRIPAAADCADGSAACGAHG